MGGRRRLVPGFPGDAGERRESEAVKWSSNHTAEAAIDTWQFDDNSAHATMDGGRTAEVKLARPATANGAGPVVLKNLKYWGAPRNDGFVMMPNEVEAYRKGPNAFEYKGTNGFLITPPTPKRSAPPTARPERPSTASG